MARLYLVGFTTDLKNLVFSTKRGAKSGTYLVSLDQRLRRTLEEVDRLEEEANRKKSPPEPPPPPVPKRASKLTPKEIQALLRAGKSPEDVARLAETDVDWIEKFHAPIIAEMAVVVEAVKTSSIAKPRLGVSAASVGQAIEANLADKRAGLSAEMLDAGWRAVRKNGFWEVSLKYSARGKSRTARFAYEPDTRSVRAMNSVASEIAWRGIDAKRTRRRGTPKSKTARKSTVRQKTTVRRQATKSRRAR